MIKAKIGDRVKIIEASEKPDYSNEVFKLTTIYLDGFIGVCESEKEPRKNYYISPLNIREILPNDKEKVEFT